MILPLVYILNDELILLIVRKTKHDIAEFWSASKMVLADLGRKITSALNSLGKATIIDEEVQPDNDV